MKVQRKLQFPQSPMIAQKSGFVYLIHECNIPAAYSQKDFERIFEIVESD